MKICLLQATYPEVHVLREIDEYPDPGRYISQHEFHHRFVDKANFRQQIDNAVSEGFDFIFNFLWGAPEDEVAGVKATEYLESLNVPFIGYRSHIQMKSKTEFYETARKRGSSPVPGNNMNSFPVIVKAARTCASQFMSEKSLCRTEAERDAAIAEINRQLEPGRVRREAQKPSSEDAIVYIPREGEHASIDNLPDDIIVQEFVPGIDYAVVVIEFGDTPIALNPIIYTYPNGDVASPDRFLTFDIKFHPELDGTLIKRDDDPRLYDTLQQLAVEAFTVNGNKGGSWGSVDIRIKPDGSPVVIEVNPMPGIFLPEHMDPKEEVILDSLPGAHRALLNIVFASCMMQAEQHGQSRLGKISEAWDMIAPGYENHKLTHSPAEGEIANLLSKDNFNGSMLDLGCGSGIFGRMIREKHASESQGSEAKNARHVGIDISPEMARLAKQAGYDDVIIGPVQECLPRMSEKFDHIIYHQAINFLNTYEVSLVLARCFMLAQKSVTIGVDEIPDEQNERIKMLPPPMNSLLGINHLQEVEEFGVPKGWERHSRERYFGWKSPSTGVDVDEPITGKGQRWQTLNDKGIAVATATQ
ncbi:unnamed protein product [Clonostachys chloroleuca]|uniref:ATP-grasp domain-containing protein n=1 Tax=Clonostachys chloroleuca TaxID=1926264 RepID=A0AA35PWB4_9HYPO|nr:unnamed protein product [Clonostachys chloroleuca]